MKRAKDAQKNKNGQRSLNGTKEPESIETGQGRPKEKNGIKEPESDETG